MSKNPESNEMTLVYVLCGKLDVRLSVQSRAYVAWTVSREIFCRTYADKMRSTRCACES